MHVRKLGRNASQVVGSLLALVNIASFNWIVGQTKLDLFGLVWIKSSLSCIFGTAQAEKKVLSTHNSKMSKPSKSTLIWGWSFTLLSRVSVSSLLTYVFCTPSIRRMLLFTASLSLVIKCYHYIRCCAASFILKIKVAIVHMIYFCHQTLGNQAQDSWKVVFSTSVEQFWMLF